MRGGNEHQNLTNVRLRHKDVIAQMVLFVFITQQDAAIYQTFKISEKEESFIHCTIMGGVCAMRIPMIWCKMR